MSNFKYEEVEIKEAYERAFNLAKSHYENFPVISFFVKKELRKHVALVYQFARTADDIADEGNTPEEVRFQKLCAYKEKLENALINKPDSEFWYLLANTIKVKKLDPQNFYKLIKAFKQDTIKKRYENFNELLEYCSNSADPVGRIILELNNINDKDAVKYSDKICTALQLANFYQDISRDIQINRIYIPLDEINEIGYSEKEYLNLVFNDAFKELLNKQVERCSGLFEDGKNLFKYLQKPLLTQIKFTVAGGTEILKKIKKQNFNVFYKRPRLSKADYILLMLKSLS